MPSVPFTLVRATTADKERVAAFAKVHYNLDEPMNLAVIKVTGRVGYPDDYDTDYIVQFLPQGYSLLAVDGDDIIGIAIMREIDTDNRQTFVELLKKAELLDYKLFYSFYNQVEREARFKVEGDPEKTLELHILAVSAAARGKGVGKALVEAGWQVARDHGFKLFRMDCTGHFSARLAEACGMKCVYTLNYQDYVDDKGKVIFETAEPHKAFKVYKKEL